MIEINTIVRVVAEALEMIKLSLKMKQLVAGLVSPVFEWKIDQHDCSRRLCPPISSYKHSEMDNTLQNERKKSRLEQIPNSKARAGGDSLEKVLLKNRREMNVYVASTKSKYSFKYHSSRHAYRYHYP